MFRCYPYAIFVWGIPYNCFWESGEELALIPFYVSATQIIAMKRGMCPGDVKHIRTKSTLVTCWNKNTVLATVSRETLWHVQSQLCLDSSENPHLSQKKKHGSHTNPGLCKIPGRLESKQWEVGQGRGRKKHQEYAVMQIMLWVWLKR